MRHLRLGHLSAVLLLLGCSQARSTGTSAPLVSSTFATAGETVEPPSAHYATIYHAVLKSYRPAGDRMRLLDPALLPSTPEQESGGTLGPALAEEMIADLGDRFCVSDSERVCNGRKSGGELRISPVYHQPDQRVRVVVQYTSIEQYAAVQSSTQVFLLEQSEGQWIIRERR